MRKIAIIYLLIVSYACKSDGTNYFFYDKYDSMDYGDGRETFIYKSKKNHWEYITYDTILVYSDVEKYGENSSWIIAIQKPNRDLMLERIESGLKNLFTYNYENDSAVVRFPHALINKQISNQYKKDLDLSFQLTKDSIKTYQEVAERIFENESFYQNIFKNPVNYYIINKKKDSIYGPMDEKHFLRLKNAKKIRLEFGKVPFWK